jgi:hypothetical protein
MFTLYTMEPQPEDGEPVRCLVGSYETLEQAQQAATDAIRAPADRAVVRNPAGRAVWVLIRSETGDESFMGHDSPIPPTTA